MSGLFLVRHGETVGGSALRFYGKTDVELSEVGREQMRRTAAVLGRIPFRTAYCSPLRRSAESCTIILGDRQIKPVEEPNFSEIDFGGWEGKTEEEIQRNDPLLHAAWRTPGMTGFAFPEGERRQDFQKRVKSAAERILKEPAEPALPCLATLHKGVIKVVLATLIGLEPKKVAEWTVEIGSIARLDRKSGKWTLKAINGINHLGELRMAGS